MGSFTPDMGRALQDSTEGVPQHTDPANLTVLFTGHRDRRPHLRVNLVRRFARAEIVHGFDAPRHESSGPDADTKNAQTVPLHRAARAGACGSGRGDPGTCAGAGEARTRRPIDRDRHCTACFKGLSSQRAWPHARARDWPWSGCRRRATGPGFVGPPGRPGRPLARHDPARLPRAWPPGQPAPGCSATPPCSGNGANTRVSIASCSRSLTAA